MKKLFAILLACLMLAASAAAEELNTFAGVPWGTPFEECEAALEKGTGIGFYETDAVAALYYGIHLAADPGFYTLMGMEIDAGGWMSGAPGITVCCAPDYGMEGQALEAIHIQSNIVYLGAPDTGWPDWTQLETAEEVFRRVDERYGENTCVYLAGGSEDGEDTLYYTVPEREFPYLFQDAFAFTMAENWERLTIGLAQNNVNFYITVRSYDSSYDDDGRKWFCAMGLDYFSYPWAESEFGQVLAEEALSFPWVNGKPVYVEIVP